MRRQSALAVFLHHPAQDVLEDASVPVVVRLTGCVDTNNSIEVDRFTVFLRGGHLDRLRNGVIVELLDAFDVIGLRTIEPQRLPGFALWELKRDDACLLYTSPSPRD